MINNQDRFLICVGGADVAARTKVAEELLSKLGGLSKTVVVKPGYEASGMSDRYPLTGQDIRRLTDDINNALYNGCSVIVLCPGAACEPLLTDFQRTAASGNARLVAHDLGQFSGQADTCAAVAEVTAKMDVAIVPAVQPPAGIRFSEFSSQVRAIGHPDRPGW